MKTRTIPRNPRPPKRPPTILPVIEAELDFDGPGALESAVDGIGDHGGAVLAYIVSL